MHIGAYTDILDRGKEKGKCDLLFFKWLAWWFKLLIEARERWKQADPWGFCPGTMPLT